MITCANCKQVFPAKRSDEEAQKEFDILFPQNQEKQVMVCEDCFIKIMDFNEPNRNRYIEFVDKN